MAPAKPPHLAVPGRSSTAATAARALPLNIAHRGFRAKLPENSLKAFRGALAAGAVALETDVHLTKDKVVVLSHDATLKRCFGRPDAIADCDWPFLATLRTTADPEVPLARLADLLAFLAEPAQRDVWVLLDIKRDDDPAELVTQIAAALAAAGGADAWSRRVVLGCWEAVHMRHCQDRLPGFAIAYIGFSLSYSCELLKYDCVSYFNLLQSVLVGPRGSAFVRQAHAQGRFVLAWTVNDEEWMDWSIRGGLDGLITDDPAKYADIQRRWQEHDDEASDAAKESTPLQRTDPAVAHPPGTRSLSGFYVRRWARLYARAALLQFLTQALMLYVRARFGRETTRIQASLGQA